MTFRSTQTVEAIQVTADNARQVNSFLTEHMAPAEAHGADAWLVRCPGRNKVAGRGDWIVVAGDRRIDVVDDGTFCALYDEQELNHSIPPRLEGAVDGYQQLVAWVWNHLPEINAQLGITPDTIGYDQIPLIDLAIKALADYIDPDPIPAGGTFRDVPE